MIASDRSYDHSRWYHEITAHDKVMSLYVPGNGNGCEECALPRIFIGYSTPFIDCWSHLASLRAETDPGVKCLPTKYERRNWKVENIPNMLNYVEESSFQSFAGSLDTLNNMTM